MKLSPTTQEAALVLLSLPQLRGVLSVLLDQKMQPLLDAMSKGAQHGISEYFTTREALEFVKLSKPTLNKLRREGRITAYNSSDKRVLYRRSELVAYLEKAKVKGGPLEC
ncbi:DNA binding domain-containing protein, excisionase family [Hymenobacter daecheongensis DSM 21074]|uniref:DNA binding domain-containing protein, excisionase family n=1 Tax=Hymenobacter daecheongensis DSM 21074 TaxID=1121955 RepID=A0A1M6EYR6_9BACT|nr:helix-turn-helix domain-containing protein [Hymenobacter daecheongensis]SHI90556.1 DNA binding domain-containing protein, excisionase family [Hymenobacter daecheongensis DSM 21074]